MESGMKDDVGRLKSALLRVLVGEGTRADVALLVGSNLRHLHAEDTNAARAALVARHTPSVYFALVNRDVPGEGRRDAALKIADAAATWSLTWADVGINPDGSVAP